MNDNNTEIHRISQFENRVIGLHNYFNKHLIPLNRMIRCFHFFSLINQNLEDLCEKMSTDSRAYPSR